MENNKKYIFISGCDRSGTTAAVRLLNAHSKICIGMERYKGLINDSEKLKTLTEDRFKKENFFDIKDEETNIQWDYFYNPLEEKFNDCSYVGDKVPRYFQIYGHLKSKFPNSKHIFLVRDPVEVANSWKVRAQDARDVNWLSTNDVQRAVQVWNSSLKVAYKKMKTGDLNIIFVSYSDLFSGDDLTLQHILKFLELPNSNSLKSKFQEMTSMWSERKAKELMLTNDEIEYVNVNANKALSEHALRYSDRRV